MVQNKVNVVYTAQATEIKKPKRPFLIEMLVCVVFSLFFLLALPCGVDLLKLPAPNAKEVNAKVISYMRNRRY